MVDPAIASHVGRIVKTTGDGLLLEFPSVVNAVRRAVEVQTAMADRTAAMAEDQRIAFRIGINIGDIIAIAEGDGIFGDGANIAAPAAGGSGTRRDFECTRMCVIVLINAQMSASRD